MTAAASVVVVISTNLFNCMFCVGICGVGSGSGANSGYGGSFLAHHLKHFPHHHHHSLTQCDHTHSIHLTMTILVTVILVTLVGLG